jgi:hypothetical protein
MPETPTKRKLVDLDSAASPRTAPRKKKSAAGRDEHAAVGGADMEVLKYLGRFRPRRSELQSLSSASGALTSGEEALVILLRGVASGRHGNSALRQFIIAYGAVRTFAGLRAERLDGLSPITSHLRARWASLRSAGPALPSGQVVREVDALAEACRLGGFHRNLSFASKVRLCHSSHMLGQHLDQASRSLTTFPRRWRCSGSRYPSTRAKARPSSACPPP